jgi:hypothetical protein
MKKRFLQLQEERREVLQIPIQNHNIQAKKYF